jgi:hypothetical protein
MQPSNYSLPLVGGNTNRWWSMNDQTSDILAGYAPEDQIAEARGVVKRTLRLERQRGSGPPFVKMGKQILYPIEGFRDWLKANERHPVRLTHKASA